MSVIYLLMTVAIIFYFKLPLSGLCQLMHNPIKLLQFNNIFQSPGFIGDELTLKISHYLIASTIKGVHLYKVEHIFTESNLFPQMLSIHCINTRKTKFWQFSTIMENKGTIQNTYSIHKNIFFNQLRLQALNNPHSSVYNNFTNQLWLAYSDQLTAHHIRSVKQEQAHIGYFFNYQDWLFSIPA